VNDASPGTKAVVVERVLNFPPEKVWRALTQSHLIDEWLMKNDFRAEVGHGFSLRADWGTVAGRVLTAEPPKLLSYSWGDSVLDTIVTWTLTPHEGGTLLRMEQTGFRTDQPARYYGGALAGWPKLLDALEQVLAALD
jgi:uncharacterized protein YndB with AHSA1/START domain